MQQFEEFHLDAPMFDPCAPHRIYNLIPNMRGFFIFKYDPLWQKGPLLVIVAPTDLQHCSNATIGVISIINQPLILALEVNTSAEALYSTSEAWIHTRGGWIQGRSACIQPRGPTLEADLVCNFPRAGFVFHWICLLYTSDAADE